RLEGGEAVAHLGHMCPGLGGVVVDAGKDPDPAADSGPGHGGVGAPARVGCLGDDRAVMGTGFAAAPDPLGRQQALLAQQPQHPFPAHLDLVLAAQPGPDLAVASPANGEATRTWPINPTRSGSLIEVAGPGRTRGSVRARRAQTLGA